MSSLLVRPATADDADAIAAVHVDGWRAGYGGLVPQAYLDGLDPRRRADAWRALLPDATVLVAELDGAVAGFVSVAAPARGLEEADAGEVTALYVDPSAWRRGVGRALMDAAAAELRDQGCDVAVLWVYEANERGRAFYAAMGFAPDGRRMLDERTGVPEVRLRARLD